MTPIYVESSRLRQVSHPSIRCEQSRSYDKRQGYQDINADYYLLKRGKGLLGSPALANQTTATDSWLRPWLWRRLGHAYFCQRPCSSGAIVMLTYTGVIVACGLVSKVDKDAKESSQMPSIGNDEQRGTLTHIGKALRSAKERFLYQPLQSAIMGELGLALTDSGQKTGISETLTITSAIIASCLYPWSSRHYRSVAKLPGKQRDTEVENIDTKMSHHFRSNFLSAQHNDVSGESSDCLQLRPGVPTSQPRIDTEKLKDRSSPSVLLTRLSSEGGPSLNRRESDCSALNVVTVEESKTRGDEERHSLLGLNESWSSLPV
ncbi:hypothetical protein PoB_001756800 [Plakobranchus ocellatus]|uniref:Uncharacterized protein n=1 Tax=Plakobranchus ocellatus TaxID=259542 RepID=A0AAV3Z8U2_9GAST|nr:hypothetical protein PoB_001756800 [Plakobranchus ocellatus]